MLAKFEVTFGNWFGDKKYISFIVEEKLEVREKFLNVQKFLLENPNYRCVHIKKIKCTGCINDLGNQQGHEDPPYGCLSNS